MHDLIPWWAWIVIIGYILFGVAATFFIAWLDKNP